MPEQEHPVLPSGRWNINWTDFGRSCFLALLSNLVVLVIGLAGAELPTGEQLLENLIITLKFVLLPDLLRRFGSADITVAQKKLAKAEQKVSRGYSDKQYD